MNAYRVMKPNSLMEAIGCSYCDIKKTLKRDTKKRGSRCKECKKKYYGEFSHGISTIELSMVFFFLLGLIGPYLSIGFALWFSEFIIETYETTYGIRVDWGVSLLTLFLSVPITLTAFMGLVWRFKIPSLKIGACAGVASLIGFIALFFS